MSTDTFYDLKSKFSKSNLQDLIQDIRVEDLVINESEYKAQYMHIRRAEFTGQVHFHRTDLGLGIYFEACTFNQIISFSSLRVEAYQELIWGEELSIKFKNCVFKAQVELKECKLHEGIHFEDCKFSGPLILEKIRTQHQGIMLEKCNLEGPLLIKECQIKADIHLASCQIQQTALIEYGSAENLKFTGPGTFSKGLELYNKIIRNNILFHDGLFRGEVHIKGLLNKHGGLRLFGSHFERAFFIDYNALVHEGYSGILQYSIDSCRFASGLIVKGARGDGKWTSPVKMIILELTPNLSGNLNFSDLDVGKIFMQGYNNSANISFTNVAVNEPSICETNNQGGIIFSGLRASKIQWADDQDPLLIRSSAVKMNNTHLGKALFFQSDLNSYDLIDLHNVVLTDISTSNLTWFSPSQLENHRIDSANETLKSAKRSGKRYEITAAREVLYQRLNAVREIYRQLKFASQKQGDTPQSLEFQRHELYYYKQAVTHQRPRQWSEYLILWSSASNNYGQSWLRALTGLVVFSLASYIPVGFLASDKLDYNHFASSWKDLEISFWVILENLKMWIVLLNPTHRIKDLTENIDQSPKIIYLFDLLSRIIVSYYIFQMVSAFRKFSK
ncbi:hypothetical protein [Pedobacter soli]|uniref:Pentapeptide repeat-containing protein n=1 Tax=Pedobacter soli TaxID=390242 RepID=A0A1G6JYH6_9SPHI|nr:hypothetical protein [Pedobacter soli]SDC23688.1 hypothetical protein SAMN04488024_101594 [Pedobacter soli]